MKRPLTLSMFLFVTLSQLRSEEIPNLGELSILDESWKVIAEARSKPLRKLQFAQIVFDSGDGELMSLQLQRVEGDLSPAFHKGGPWSESITHTFPSGLLEATGEVRCVSGSVELTTLRDDTPALAFTTYWCRDENKVAIAHGYSMAVGPFRVLLQHTSDKVITPEFVSDVAFSLIGRIGEQYGSSKPATEPAGKENP